MCDEQTRVAAPSSLPPVRAPARIDLPAVRPPSRHAVAVALSHTQPKVILEQVTGLSLGLTAGQCFSDNETILEEQPLLRAADCGWKDLHAEAKAARLIRSFGADSNEAPCDGDLMVKRIKALTAMDQEAKTKLMDLFESSEHLFPTDLPVRATMKTVAELATSVLQIPDLWPLDELEKGLLALALYAVEDEFVYELGSRANHCCSPNADYRISPDGVLRVHAIRSIAVGEEVTISYAFGLSLLHWKARQRALWDTRWFLCSCRMCSHEQLAEERAATTSMPGDNTEPDAEPDGEISYVSSEPDSELSSVPASASRPSNLLPQSHLRCVRCVPLESNGHASSALDQATYVRWLADAMSVPSLRRIGKVCTERRAVVGTSWRCTTCRWTVDLLRDNLSDDEKKFFELAQVEMQLTYQILEQYNTPDSKKLLELWPTCERVLGPWHGATLFCALQSLPMLTDDRAYKVRARLAVAGVSDSLIMSRSRRWESGARNSRS